mmetsp:Transcript_10488/g.23830  ORF Transcript_10488/g.23830 Transcript_10488/m.23830 type:complete len:192 (+) Transcript_10488:78-653(+)
MGRKNKRSALGDPDGEEVTYEGRGDAVLTALFEGDVDAATKLVEAGDFHVDAIDQLGWQALHRAAFGGFTGLIPKLVERNASIHAADLDGLQPLHIAASRGHVETCKLLLEARAAPDVPDNNGLSAQCYAMICAGEAAEQLKELLGAPELPQEDSDVASMTEADLDAALANCEPSCGMKSRADAYRVHTNG